MKKLFLLFIALVVGVSCNTEIKNISPNTIKGNGIIKEDTRKVEPYQSIESNVIFDVILTNDPQGEIRIVAEENILPIILTEVKEQHLFISVKPKNNFSTQRKIIVYVPAQGVNTLNLIGSGDIKYDGTLNVPQLKLNLIGSGDIDLKNVITEKVEINLRGSGDIDLGGKTKQITANLQGSGDISAFDLIAENAEVSVQGSGDVDVTATQSFEGKVSGSGNIKVKGNPKNVSRKTSGSGKITIL